MVEFLNKLFWGLVLFIFRLLPPPVFGTSMLEFFKSIRVKWKKNYFAPRPHWLHISATYYEILQRPSLSDAQTIPYIQACCCHPRLCSYFCYSKKLLIFNLGSDFLPPRTPPFLGIPPVECTLAHNQAGAILDVGNIPRSTGFIPLHL
jgi:hypothetical protein